MSPEDKNIDIEKDFDRLWEESVKEPKAMHNADAIFDAISEHIDVKETSPSLFSKYSEILKYAAALIVFLSVGGYFILNNKSAGSIDTNSKMLLAKNEQMIILDDDSKIELFNNSKLRYPKYFDGKTRTVHLEGSAQFSITKDSLKPFFVHQGNLTTEVLGTKFLIEDDSIQSITKIYLYSGKIAITNKEKTLQRILLPGDSLIYNKLTDKEFIQSNVIKQASLITAEKAIENKLSITFSNVKLKDAYKLVQQKTGILIDCSNIGIDGELIISLEYENKPVYKIINDLNSFSEFSYEIKNNAIVISK